VLLHWYIHKDGTGVKREMDFSVWKKLNMGVEAGSTDVPEHVQQRVHAIVSRSFILELAVATANSRNRGEGGGADEGGGHGPGDDWAAMGAVASERPRSPVLSPSAALEGWAQIVGGGFPKPSGLSGVQTVTYRHMSNIFSEVTNSSGMLKGPLVFGEGAQPSVPAGPSFAGKPGMTPPESNPGPRRDDFTWLSICYTLLFFSASPVTGSPYAFVELQRVAVSGIQQENRIITLTGVAEKEDTEDLAAAGPTINSTGEGASSISGQGVGKGGAAVVIVLLLPDGRWQELSLPKLDLRIPTAGELDMWVAHLTAASEGKVMKPSSTRSASPRHASQKTGPRQAPTAGGV